MISIVIPVYNAGAFIQRTVDSIICQIFTDWELILVDDGSVDDSYRKCLDCANQDSRIRVIHQNNGGASMARNTGMKLAKGQFCCFVDSDDYVDPSYVADLVRDMNISQEIDLVIHGLKIFNQKRQIKNAVLPNILYSSVEELFGNINCFQFCGPCAKLFRLDLIKENGIWFDKDITLAEDYDFLLRYLLKCRKTVSSDKLNYNYEHHEGSVSSKLHSPAVEYKSLITLDGSFDQLVGQTEKDNIIRQRDYVITYFIYRFLNSFLADSSCTKEHFMSCLNVLPNKYRLLYKKCYKPETKLLSFMKFLFVNHQDAFLWKFLSFLKRCRKIR